MKTHARAKLMTQTSVEPRKPDSKQYILHDAIFIKFKNSLTSAVGS